MEAEFLDDYSSDKSSELLLPLGDHLRGWLLFTSTTTHTKMDLSKPLPPPPSDYSTRQLIPRRPVEMATYQHPLTQPEYTLSIPSESSDPGMAEDPPSWSGSDTTFTDQSSESEIWDSYFWSQDKNYFLDPFQVDSKVNSKVDSTFHGPESTLSLFNRNFASSNLSGLNFNECPTALHRSDATRTPRRCPKSLPQNTYSPFPTVSPSPTRRREPAHKSWPLHDSEPNSLRPALRSRAHTTPSNYKSLAPSNISTCSTLDAEHSPTHSTASSASGLYMRSTPISPDFEPLMNLMEKSYFDDDSDDEGGGLAGLVNRLQIRSSSANSGPVGNKEKTSPNQGSRKNSKTAGDVFKGMFARKKSVSEV